MEETRINEERIEEITLEEPKTKKKYSLKIQKTIATLLITVGLAVAAFCGVRLLSLALNTDALNIDMEDWLQDKSYGDSDTLAWHMMSDINDIITYMGLQQALEDEGVLSLNRPALVVQKEDGTIITYTMAELVAEGEKMGLYVYDEITEDGHVSYYYESMAPTVDYENSARVRILWSLMDQEDASVDLGVDVWAARQKRIDEVIAQAQKEDVAALLAVGQIPVTIELERMSLRELIKLCGDLPTLYPGTAAISNEQLLNWLYRCEELETQEKELLSQRPEVEENTAWEETTEFSDRDDLSYDNTEAPEDDVVADITAPVTESVGNETDNVEIYWTPELQMVRREQQELRREIYEKLDDRRASQNTDWGYLHSPLERFLHSYLQRYYELRQKMEQPGNLSYQIILTQGNKILMVQDPHTEKYGQTLYQEDAWDMSYTYDSDTRRIVTDMPTASRELPMQRLSNWSYRNYDNVTIRFGINVDDLSTYKDAYAQEAFTYQSYRNGVFLQVGSMVICALLVLVGMIWMVPLCGRRDKEETIHLNLYDRIPTELGAAGILLMGLGVYVVVLLAADGMPELWYGNVAPDIQFWILCGLAAVLLILVYVMLWWGFYGLIRRLKAHTFLKNSLCAILIRWCLKPLGWCRKGLSWCGQKVRKAWNALLDNGDVTWKTAAVFMGYVLIHFFLCVSCAKTFYFGFGFGGVTFLLLLILNGLVGAYLILKAAQRKRIRQGVTKIAGGKLDHQLSLEQLSGEEKRLAREINQIGGGLKAAVEESLKNERMKTELITNVSHDIKTPLTSIINYVDLLKRENIEDPKIQGYIQVLDQKSQRLKTLTEDLVEASKASSGTLQMTKEKIDFVELINQTTGEFSDRFAAAHLNLVTNIQETPAYIMADGRYVWRILENLYRNAEKYSMPGTRVYIEVFVKIGRVFFVMKNVSNAPLNIKAEELTERFIRGDVSRTTEGSGLGLSIAKDMTELMDGTFRVYLDGDLFRVTVSFAVIRSQKTDLKEMEENIRRRVAQEEKKVQVDTADVVEESGFESTVSRADKSGIERQGNVKLKRIPALSLPKITLPNRKKKGKAGEE